MKYPPAEERVSEKTGNSCYFSKGVSINMEIKFKPHDNVSLVHNPPESESFLKCPFGQEFTIHKTHHEFCRTRTSSEGSFAGFHSKMYL